MREEHYRKEKIKSRDIEGEAMEMEQKFILEIKTLSDRKRLLTESLKHITNKMNDMYSQLQINAEELSKQQKVYIELMEINKQMISSIRILESENTHLHENLKQETYEKTKIQILENHLLTPSSDLNLSQTNVPETIATAETSCIDANTQKFGKQITQTPHEQTLDIEAIGTQKKLLIIGDESAKYLTGDAVGMKKQLYITKIIKDCIIEHY